MSIVSVQRTTNDDISLTTHTLTIAATTAGSTLFIGARINNTTDASVVNSLVLGAGGANRTFSRVARQFGVATLRNLEVWMLENAAGAETIITLTLSSAFIVRWGTVEVTGLATSSSIDQQNKATSGSTGTAVDSGPITTTQVNEFIFVAMASELPNTFSAGSGYGNLQSATRYAQEEHIVSALGTYNGTFTIGTTDNWSSIIVSVKAAPNVNGTGATGTVEAELSGFGNGWTDITVDVTMEPITITRGFQSADPDDLVAAPSMASFGLLSVAGIIGRYSPDSVNCLVGWGLSSRVRIKVMANGSTRTRFIGWVQTITPTPGLYEAHTVKVTAASWLQLATDTLATGLSVQTGKRGDQLLTSLVGVVQFAPPSTSYDLGVDAYPYALDDINAESSYIIDGIDSVAKSGVDRVFEKADGTLVYENRSKRQIGATNILNLTDTAPVGQPGLAIVDMPLERRRSALWNQFLVTVHPKKVDGSAVVLYQYQTSASSSSATIGAGATVILDGPYQDPNQQAQRVAGFGMIDNGAGGLPGTDWEIRDAPNGGGSIISGSFTISVTFEVNKAIFTIVSASGVIGYINKLQCRGQGVYDYQVVIGRAINSGNVTTIGRRTLTINCPYQATPQFAQDLANYFLALYGTERSQLDRGVQAFVNYKDESSLDTLLSLEISSPIGVQETVTGLFGAYWVNGMSESYDEFWNATIGLYLAPRWTGVVWQLGTAGSSELGSTTVLAYV